MPGCVSTALETNWRLWRVGQKRRCNDPMEARHVQMKPARAYLLGRLPAHEADALEVAYFKDPAFVDEVLEVEEKLILDYLENRLPRSERIEFESRYLVVPQLQERLAEVRSKWAESSRSSTTRWAAWRAALASFAVLVMVGSSGLFYLYRSRVESVPIGSIQLPVSERAPAMAYKKGAPVVVRPREDRETEFAEQGANAYLPPAQGGVMPSHEGTVASLSRWGPSRRLVPECPFCILGQSEQTRDGIPTYVFVEDVGAARRQRREQTGPLWA